MRVLIIWENLASALRSSTFTISQYVRRQIHTQVISISRGEILSTHREQQTQPENQAEEKDDLSGELHMEVRTSHELDRPDRRAELTEMLDSVFSEKDHPQIPPPFDRLEHYDFVYDVRVCASTNNEFQRRMMLSFHMDVNIISDEVYRTLETELQPYDGDPIAVLGCPDRKPLGTVTAQWTFCGRTKPYRTVFYVVPNVEYDLLIGRPSMRQQELYRADPKIATRLNASYRCGEVVV